MTREYITGFHTIGPDQFPQVSTQWSGRDRWQTIKVRWSVGRMNYRIKPDLYAVGSPDRNSRVFVTANYKLSFDHLRRALDGLDAWILVLDTKGINVWCAAGKKNFSTKEVVRRIRIHHLDQVVDHRKIILPQLGATGVAAHKVKQMTGFNVIYGPVRAADIKAFLAAGLKADGSMRTITFPFMERIKLIPVDIFYGKYYMLAVPAVFVVLAGLNGHGYSLQEAVQTGWRSTIALFSGYLAGCVLTPALLPWIPFRRFSLKGIVAGCLVAGALAFAGILGHQPLEMASWFLIIGAISSFMAMNFTGSSTYTSLSGVQKEMKTALPVQITAAALGVAGWILTRFVAI